MKNVKPPETSAKVAPAALNPASIRVAPGEMRNRSVVDLVEHAHGETGEQRDAAAQALRKIDFAAHRARGDRRDFRLDALHVGDLVDALDRDQRRIHVHRDDPHAVKPAIRGDKAGIAASRAGGLDQVRMVRDLRKAVCGRRTGAERNDRACARFPRERRQRLRRKRRRLHDEIGGGRSGWEYRSAFRTAEE